MANRRGMSYAKRVVEVNRIYDRYARSGLSNREIWRRYIYPVYWISERTFYNMMNASTTIGKVGGAFGVPSLFDFDEEERKEGIDERDRERGAEGNPEHTGGHPG